MLTYQMYNFMSRWAWDVDSDSRVLLQTEYFKSYGPEEESSAAWRERCSRPYASTEGCRNSKPDVGFSDFKMEAWVGKLAYS